MNAKKWCKGWVRGAIGCSAMSLTILANATIVQFQTSLGDFEVNLYDEDTPETVANFLAYLEAGAYSDTLIHRSIPGFVVQGGGFFLDADGEEKAREALWSPINEPVFSNVRATIAMAKVGGDPNSATNQWFFNLADNSANLDVQNGGFTVFGEVIGDGMNVVDAIAALPTYNADGGVPGQVPLRDYDYATEQEDFAANPQDYLVFVHSVTVLDAAVDTAADLSPALNTSLPVVRPKKKSGAASWLVLLGLGTLAGAGIVGRRRV